jgi:hypothetical protein
MASINANESVPDTPAQQPIDSADEPLGWLRTAFYAFIVFAIEMQLIDRFVRRSAGKSGLDNFTDIFGFIVSLLMPLFFLLAASASRRQVVRISARVTDDPAQRRALLQIFENLVSFALMAMLFLIM